MLNPVAVKDNGQGGYYEYGVWSTATGGYNGSNRVAGPGTSATNAQWALKVPPGTYDFYATWTSSASNSNTAPFTLIDGFTRLGMVSVNQQLAPADAQYGGILWSKLGTFTVTKGTVMFVLAATNEGNVVADGVLLAPTSTASPSFTLKSSVAIPAPTTTTSALAATPAADGSQAAAVDASLVALQDQAAAAQDALITGVAQDQATKRKP